MTVPDTTPEAEAMTARVLSRRTLLGGAAAGFGVLVPGALIARATYADDEDEIKDAGEDENSGPGSDDDEDKLEDHGREHHDDDGAADDDDACDLDDDCVTTPGEVRIDDDDADGFTPGTITVAVGDSVTWFNDDDKPHTATGGDWDTGTIEPGESASVTFDEAGEFPYSCQFHPVMTGTVMVIAEGTPVASPVASPEASPAVAVPGEVTIFNFAYDPATIDVPVGTTVTWRNDDGVPHTASGRGGVFDSGTIDAGGTGTVTFDTPGTFEYGCAFHAGMSGTVVVT